MVLTVSAVRTEEDAAEVRALVAEFVQWLDVRYPEHREQLAEYFRVQGLERQMAELLTVGVPPAGECLLARIEEAPAGTVMLKSSGSGVCEMNRMYVREAARGRGAGEALGRALLGRARALGFRRMVLSAGVDHREAIPLYHKLGFVDDPSLPDTGGGDLERRMSCEL